MFNRPSSAYKIPFEMTSSMTWLARYVTNRKLNQQGTLQASQVSSEALEQLIAMGFEEQAARVALQQTGNDVQAALSRLL